MIPYPGQGPAPDWWDPWSPTEPPRLPLKVKWSKECEDDLRAFHGNAVADGYALSKLGSLPDSREC
jgi:hypothetical protein